MTNDVQQRAEAALSWLVKAGDPEFSDWDAFTEWLEASPENAAAYHAVADSEAELLPIVAELAPPPVRAARLRHSQRGWAVAAGVAACAALGVALLPDLSGTTYSTVPGEMRTIALADGDRLVMNGDTQIRLAGLGRREIRLDHGQLLLSLEGRDKGAVQVRSGDLALVDVGTVFEVSRDGRSTRVIVSEGAVIADPDGARLRIERGQKLEADDGAALLRSEPGVAAAVGAWRQGQLAYLDEPLIHVAADLGRSTGIDFSVTSAMGRRRFSGTLSVSEVKRDPASLGPLLGVPIKPSGRRWKLGEGP